KVNSANENACNGGPVSSNRGATFRSELTTDASVSTKKFSRLNFARSRSQAFDCATTMARRVLQHCTCEHGSFCFAGLEWNGHSLCAPVAFRCDSGERAMIRDCDPRTDRNHHANAPDGRFHFPCCSCLRVRFPKPDTSGASHSK